MRFKKTTTGAFSYYHSDLATFHDTGYKNIRNMVEPDYSNFLARIQEFPVDVWFDNSHDETCNMTFIDVLTEIQPSPENDDRTKDQISQKKRMPKLSLADENYTTIPTCQKEGDNTWYQETYHLHLFVYTAIIAGVIDLDPEVKNVIPMFYTVKKSSRRTTDDGMIQRINSHDNKSDILSDAELNAMDLVKVGMDSYVDHKCVKNGTTLHKKLLGRSATARDVFEHPYKGLIFKTYLDCTDGSGNRFPSSLREEECLMERQLVNKLKPESFQSGFTEGYLGRAIQYYEEGELTLEEVCTMMQQKLRVPQSLNEEEKGHLKDAVCLTYGLQPTRYLTSTNMRDKFIGYGRLFCTANYRSFKGLIHG